ncbi:flagellar biosynthesis anti-sigma factor FlgM [Luteimonas sp. Y-2-2-4F]|nr:flagellar biosynthesis anti-sigma factor FlgM [Luteimonas sp. Y-2-2-4F]MCD9030412.1 flagellar biosynthesis anti-sigma factor FlgM [Luteimonas sp. Y-2-2-4F]
MSHKIEGLPPPAALRGAGALGGQVARAGDDRDKPVEAAAAGDSLRLTGEAAGLQAMQRELTAQPAVDQTRVQAVREALAAGTYRVDPEAIASAMLDLDARLGGR